MRLFSALAFFFVFATHVFAQSFSAEQMDALKARVATFEKAMSTMEINGLVDVMPPKIKNFIMTKGNVNEQQLKDAIQATFTQAAETVTIQSFTMDFTNAESKRLSDGMDILIAPTETRMEIKGTGKVLATSATVAFIEDGVWYLLRADAQQIPIIHEVYPAFKDVTLPADKMEVIKD
jgi:hypothetical protein